MADEHEKALLTPLGREEKLRELEGRVDGLEHQGVGVDSRLSDVEHKWDARDRRAEIFARYLGAIALAAVGSLITALITLGIHP
jgi:hypothetical protein